MNAFPEEPWMSLAAVRRWFGRLKAIPGSKSRPGMVHTDYVDLACAKGLKFHRDPVTERRYWLESELLEYVRESNVRTLNLPLRVPPGPKPRVRRA